MKTAQDIYTRLHSELGQWFIKQCRNPSAAYYLYYMESTPEHDGGLLIAENQPSGLYKLAMDERINGYTTVTNNMAYIRNSGTLDRLPILS